MAAGDPCSLHGTEKTVTMIEKGHKGKEWFAVDSPNSWDVRINEIIPVNLSVEVGAGETSLNSGLPEPCFARRK